MVLPTGPRRHGWFARFRGSTNRNCLSPAEFDAAFEVEASRAERSNSALALVVFAAQHGPGTSEGIDELLEAIEERKRQYDTIGRLEANRVGVLLPYTRSGGAWAFASDVLKRLGTGNNQFLATVSSNEVGPSGKPAAFAPKEVASPPKSRRGKPAPDAPRAGEEEVDELAPEPARPEDISTLASIWYEFGHRPSLGKRFLDVLGSGTALVLLSPVLLGAATAVKLSSPGPVLFRQVRAGQFGRPFELVKFRSMFVDAEARKSELMHLNEMDGPVFKIKNDPRITPVGRWLRRTSIDELPQLWNVLRGDMSLVGPRPPMLEELPGYEQWHLRRLTRRGGLTCIWQTSGRNQIPFREWMRMDRRYMRQESMLTDLRLIAKTVWTVTIGRGAS